MPLIRAEALGEDYEDKPPKDGEYEFRVMKAEYKPTKKGDRNLIAVMLRVEGTEGDGLTPVNENLTIPNNDEENPATTRMMMRTLTRFLAAFGYPTDKDFDPESDAQSLVGLTGKARVKNMEGEDGNFYPRLQLPKVEKR